jgi:hypothetical protein
MTASQIIALLTLRLEKLTGEKIVLDRQEIEKFSTKHPTIFKPTKTQVSLEVPTSSLKQEEIVA